MFKNESLIFFLHTKILESIFTLYIQVEMGRLPKIRFLVTPTRNQPKNRLNASCTRFFFIFLPNEVKQSYNLKIKPETKFFEYPICHHYIQVSGVFGYPKTLNPGEKPDFFGTQTQSEPRG